VLQTAGWALPRPFLYIHELKKKTNPLYTLPSYLLKYILILSFHVRPGVPVSLSRIFLHKFCTHLSFPIRTTYAQIIVFTWSTHNNRCATETMKLVFVQFSPASRYFPHFYETRTKVAFLCFSVINQLMQGIEMHLWQKINIILTQFGRSRWPRGLGHELSSLARTLG
jgi:hypothetical protein